MTTLDAFQIILDLAKNNTLDEAQREALGIFEEFVSDLADNREDDEDHAED